MNEPIVPIERLHRQHEAAVLTELERFRGWVSRELLLRRTRGVMTPFEAGLALERLISAGHVHQRKTMVGRKYRIDKPIPMIDAEPIDGNRGAA